MSKGLEPLQCWTGNAVAHMEKDGRMVFSISRLTFTGLRSLCSLSLDKNRRRSLEIQMIFGRLHVETSRGSKSYGNRNHFHFIISFFLCCKLLNNFSASAEIQVTGTLTAL